jgi:hypothetical protein
VRFLESFQGSHRDATIVVCGCGSSLNDLPHPERFITVGVNDVGRRFDPTYLVVVNPRSQFSPERFRHVEESRAAYVFTQLDLGLSRRDVVRFQLGEYGGTTFDDPHVLHYTRNSPYVALCLAIHMGARRIGLIGVDFTDHHFFGNTGRHPLTSRLRSIDAEYRRLREAAARRGVQIANLGATSRLTAFPRATLDSWLPHAKTPGNRARVFCVTYDFLACGDVFTTGLRHAARETGVEWADAACDDGNLPAKVGEFAPDLLLVVHGRRFARRWRSMLGRFRSAVWLLDEPYEVDDTVTFSGLFQDVFVNDPATLDRHRNAHYLPVCYDPSTHYPHEGPRPYDVGFIGGGNRTRERLLGGLADRGRLSYVVGGPWRHSALQRLSRGRNVPPHGTAAMYRSTRIVINVFRDLHHFNHQRIAGTSMNPRIYEALACGALVVSEGRPEITSNVPELPVFGREADLLPLVETYLADDDALESTRDACIARLRGHTYAVRLRKVLSIALSDRRPSLEEDRPMVLASDRDRPRLPAGWEICGPVDVAKLNRSLSLRATCPPEAGSERGIVTIAPRRESELSFEVFVPSEATFIAKINQVAKVDQNANSYHLYCEGGTAYLARHCCVFKTFTLPRDTWVELRLAHDHGWLTVCVADGVVHHIRDMLLPEGFAFLGVKRGEVRLRKIRMRAVAGERVTAPTTECETICPPSPEIQPRVSIVTTVYDRVECLKECIRSVQGLRYQGYEHIIVSDCPPRTVVNDIAALLQSLGDTRISYLNLWTRHNNWGIAPAAAGLRQSRGEYVCFLSDDNGYTPEHVGTLVQTLDRERALGFAYSSCRYAGRFMLRHPVPAPARIDLGQPLFRRDVFRLHFEDDLPFQMMAWDWALIDTLVRLGVRWRHVDVPSFIFRLRQYPHLASKP